MTQGVGFPAALNDVGAYDIAQAMLDGFNRHYRLFRETSAAAKARFEAASAELEPSTPEEFRAFIAKQIDNWGKRVKEAGIQPE